MELEKAPRPTLFSGNAYSEASSTQLHSYAVPRRLCLIYPQEGGSRVLRSAGNRLQDYTI
jgi:hypothetical protein